MIKEHGVKQLRFRTREGRKQDWRMLATDVKKASKSVATTCDGDGGGECHVLFTRHGGTIIKVGDVDKSYGVNKVGLVRGAGGLTPILFDVLFRSRIHGTSQKARSNLSVRQTLASYGLLGATQSSRY